MDMNEAITLDTPKGYIEVWPAEVAKEFTKRLHGVLSSQQIAHVRARNKSPEYVRTGSCASHDFCDANVPMAEAFEAITGIEMIANNQTHAEIWNAAWKIAKENEFTFQQTKAA